MLMKKLSSIVLICMLFIQIGCNSQKASADASASSTSVSTPASVSEEGEVALRGTFLSKKGVMAPISCYCFNGGVLTTEEGKRISLCFKESDAVSGCSVLSVKGNFTVKRIDPGPNNPCPAGEKRYLEVTSFTCK